MSRPLRVFLCHATEDKPAVRELYKKLANEPWIKPWMDEENLLPGQDFDLEIYKALRDSDAILICLSKTSVAKEGYLNKEIRRALEAAEEKQEGTIYIIPVKFDECTSSFAQLQRFQWLNYFNFDNDDAYFRLLKTLKLRYLSILDIEKKALQEIEYLQEDWSLYELQQLEDMERKAEIKLPEGRSFFAAPKPILNDDLDIHSFIKILLQKDSKVTYPFWIGKYPVTNAQYERFLNAPDYANPVYRLEFPKSDENCQPMGDWGRIGLDWLREELKKANAKVLLPRLWDHKDFGKANPNHPVVGISWYEACAYAEWLFQHWEQQAEARANPSLKPKNLRLPLETEWVAAAGGETPSGRYPWDAPGQATTSLKEILRRANVAEAEIGHTTAVDAYPLGGSPLGVRDLAGNVWEWQGNFYDKDHVWLALRGGSWSDLPDFACVSARAAALPDFEWPYYVGFRVVAFSPPS